MIDKVLKQIKTDVETGNLEALSELLEQCPTGALNNYLPEDEQE